MYIKWNQHNVISDDVTCSLYDLYRRLNDFLRKAFVAVFQRYKLWSFMKRAEIYNTALR